MSQAGLLSKFPDLVDLHVEKGCGRGRVDDAAAVGVDDRTHVAPPEVASLRQVERTAARVPATSGERSNGACRSVPAPALLRQFLGRVEGPTGRGAPVFAGRSACGTTPRPDAGTAT